MMVDFQEDNFEQKLLGLKDTQDSIQSLSIWCLKHQSHHKKIVNAWLHVLKKIKLEQRVTLFYLANDVIQYSKRKNFPFVESWATALQRATPLVRDSKVKGKILRLFKIWEERGVYDESFITDLSGLLTAHTKKSNQQNPVDLIQEFQPSFLFTKIRKCKVLEEDTDLKLKLVKQSTIPISDIDALQVVVKDRRNGDDLIQDLDDGIVKLEAYTKALECEIKDRIDVINVLEVSEQFYDTQRGEVKVVCNAYRNFGNRIKSLKRHLEELLPNIPSPVPSPDINAPSPSSESDIDIPEEDRTTGSTLYDSEKSFIGTDFVTAMNSGASEKQLEFMKSMEQQTYNFNAPEQTQYNPYSYSSYDMYQGKMDSSMTSSGHGYYSNDLESPASPTEKHQNTDPYVFRPNNASQMEEGKPIEVISSGNSDSHNFSVGQFLQNLVSNPAPEPALPAHSRIPGLESPTSGSREVFNFIESKVKGDMGMQLPWEEKPVTKYQSWPSPEIPWSHSQETPVSPPPFKCESYNHPPEYIDTSLDNNRYAMGFPPDHRPVDVDHRILNRKPPNLNHKFDMQISAIPLPKHDVDERISTSSSVGNCNLISLTSSPSVNDAWKNSSDSDYRAIPMPPTPPVLPEPRKSQDLIESVDMEMSDDESTEMDQSDPNTHGRHRKMSHTVKDEDERTRLTKQLQPPPCPWDMLNIPVDGDESGSSKLNDSIPNLETPNSVAVPNNAKRPEFAAHQYSMPPNVPPSFGPPPPRMMRPPGPEQMFRPPPDFSRMPPPNNFNNPFNFISDRMPMFAPNNQSNFNHPPRKERFTNDSHHADSDRGYGSDSNDYAQGINTIEPLIKNRQFENSSPPAKSAVRSNLKSLKEISLSDILEKSMTENDKERAKENTNSAVVDENDVFSRDPDSTDNLDLFNDEPSNEVEGGDDGDDLYNNIEERVNNDNDSKQTDDRYPLSRQLSSEFRLIQNSNFVVYESEEDLEQNSVIMRSNTSVHTEASPPKHKAPFQGTLPKVQIPMMAPPTFMDESEERLPWPLLPVIDLSNENNSPSGEYDANTVGSNFNADKIHNPPFLQTNGSPNFRPRFPPRGGLNPLTFLNSSPHDKRFANDMGRPGRFSTPRQEFRPRGNMTPNSDFRLHGNMTPNSDFRPRGMIRTPEFRPRGGMSQEYKPRGMMGTTPDFRPRGDDQMRRMQRPNFRSVNPGNVRGNLQNTPRIFKGGRPFRRGW